MKGLRTLAILLLSVATTVQSLGQPPVAKKVVVLRNGNVLEGQVDQLGDVVRVVTDTSEIRLAIRDVEGVVATIQDAYEAKRAEVRQDVAVDHIRLAIWCIRQEIWQSAAGELAAARKIDPNHPEIAFVERRLEVASRAAMRAARQHEVQLTSTETNSGQARDEELGDLEALAASLPDGTLESFARHVQPILVNGCAAGGCHSMDDTRQFRINRDLVRGVANRESTLRNLQAVWNEIDHANVEYSPLLTQPAVPHGGLARPVFAGHRQKVQEKLAEWVREATGANTPVAPDPTIELAGHQMSMLPPPQVPPLATTPAGDEGLHFWEYEQAEGDAAALVPQTPQVQRGIAPKKYQPRDEFDPELFNRRMDEQPSTP